MESNLPPIIGSKDMAMIFKYKKKSSNNISQSWNILLFSINRFKRRTNNNSIINRILYKKIRIIFF